MKTPEQVLMSAVIERVVERMKQDGIDVPAPLKEPLDTQEQIDAAIKEIEERGLDDHLYDAKRELRDSYTHETLIECDWSRHYESKSVAAKFGDRWVGWTYWYGGGKFGEPETIEWMEDAYFVDAKEETKIVLVFRKAEQ